MNHAALRLYATAVGRALRAWSLYAAQCVGARRKLFANAVQRMRHSLVALVLEQWRAYVARNRRLIARAAYYFGAGHLLAKSFAAWKEKHEHHAEVRHGANHTRTVHSSPCIRCSQCTTELAARRVRATGPQDGVASQGPAARRRALARRGPR